MRNPMILQATMAPIADPESLPILMLIPLNSLSDINCTVKYPYCVA